MQEKLKKNPFSSQRIFLLKSSHLQFLWHLVGYNKTKDLSNSHQLEVDFIARSWSHHPPPTTERTLPFQIGSATTSGPRKCNKGHMPTFAPRCSLGGQEHSLVSDCEDHSFWTDDFCLNLARISNISFEHNGKKNWLTI